MKQIFIRTLFAVLVTLVLLSFTPQASVQAESVAQQQVAQVSEQSEEKVIIFSMGKAVRTVQLSKNGSSRKVFMMPIP